MLVCEACGQRLVEPAQSCSRCGRPVPERVSAGHLSRTALAGRPGASSYPAVGDAAPAAASARFSDAAPFDAAHVDPGSFTPAEAHASEPAPPIATLPASSGPDPSSPSSPEWDPDATTKFTPIYASHSRGKNIAALVGLAICVVAAVVSLAGLIAQTVGTGPALARPSATASASPTVLSTVVPRNATVCTPELARNNKTNCTVAQRVFAAVRTLGTDLPDKFRVTITDPQTSKNATFVCSIKSWIECDKGDATIYVRRVA